MLNKKTANIRLAQQIKAFEKKNPAIKEAIKLLDMSMDEYGRALKALDPAKTFTSNSTAVFKKL